jgi:hypothetical protein
VATNVDAAEKNDESQSLYLTVRGE